ncbi:MAG TPA: hypothetical protein VJP80_08010 [Candidatus Saccharimonadales bacterium]|nr:hypothetical protein [Candidatus Saccharimonadales bacterium]
MFERVRHRTKGLGVVAVATLALTGCSQSSFYHPPTPDPTPSLVAAPSGSPDVADYRAACDFLTDKSPDDVLAVPPPIQSVAAILVNRAWMDRSGAFLVGHLQTGNEVDTVQQINQLTAMPSNNDAKFASDAALLTQAARQAILSNLASSLLNKDGNPNTVIAAGTEARLALDELNGSVISDASTDPDQTMRAVNDPDAEHRFATRFNQASQTSRDTLNAAANGIQDQLCGSAG